MGATKDSVGRGLIHPQKHGNCGRDGTENGACHNQAFAYFGGVPRTIRRSSFERRRDL